MSPAFRSPGHTAFLGAVLIFFLTLPITVHALGSASLEDMYRGISERAGSFDYIRRQIFDEKSPVDVMFCGSSLLRLAIDPRIVSDALTARTGRPANVLMVPQSWQGPDMNYFVSRDLMEHRRVRMLVIAAPAFIHRSRQPHVQLFRVTRYGDHPGALDGLDLPARTAIYSAWVLGSLRQALNEVRPNRVAPAIGRTLELPPSTGYMGRPLVERHAAPATLDAQSLFLSDSNTPAFTFDGPQLNGYQMHFLRKTVELAREHGTLLVILHMPSPSQLDQSVVPDRRGMPAMLGPGVAFGGVPSRTLFRNVPPDQVLDYFQDEHLNRNGMRLYSETVAPALAQLFEAYAKNH